MKIHIPSLIHRDVTTRWEPCAYTGKILRLCQMLTDEGHEVILYSGPECDAEVAEHVVVISQEERITWFGNDAWEETVFNEFDGNSVPWQTFNSRIIAEIEKRIGIGDIVGLTMGASQYALDLALGGGRYVVAEVGVGYEGILLDTHHCFESEAWRHYLYGRNGINDGRFFDVVIPNAYDPTDYEFRAEKDGYLLLMARMIERKGLGVVSELAKRFPVITAGPGDLRVPGANHVGVVRGDDKAKLLAGASALLAPTSYIGPFEGVTVEAMLSGTPAITTPWGVFSETIADGWSGQKCSSLGEFIEAAEAALSGSFNALRVRDYATQRYSMAVVGPQYTRWMNRLQTLYKGGWYT